jgi:hypothetical protein
MGDARPSVAIIGSFRQHYPAVIEAWSACTSNGILVTSPKGTPIIEDGVPFVRFESDKEDYDDPAVQSLALHRIMRADLVLVVAPDGYVGRTTCYEIGRVVQAQRPLYFTERPKDLPIRVGTAHVVTSLELALRLASGGWIPQPLFLRTSDPQDCLEQELLNGSFRTD